MIMEFQMASCGFDACSFRKEHPDVSKLPDAKQRWQEDVHRLRLFRSVLLFFRWVKKNIK